MQVNDNVLYNCHLSKVSSYKSFLCLFVDVCVDD